MEIWRVGADVSECPFWDDATQMLYWVDIRAPSLHRYAAGGKKLRSWSLPEPVGAFALLEDGNRALVALASGLAVLDLETDALERLMAPEPERPANRLNEGKVSPCGQHFVFGSMDDRVEKEATGALYCLSADRSLRVLTRGLIVANGVAWSPDGRVLYFSDSRASMIWANDWDADTGTIANRRVFASPTEAEGRPDGAAMDQDGHYWSAGVSAGCLNRFAPNGRIAHTIRLPIQAPTMPVFGGSDGASLFVTSHRRVANPKADDGSIVVLPVSQRGTLQRRFSMG